MTVTLPLSVGRVVPPRLAVGLEVAEVVDVERAEPEPVTTVLVGAAAVAVHQLGLDDPAAAVREGDGHRLGGVVAVLGQESVVPVVAPSLSRRRR